MLDVLQGVLIRGTAAGHQLKNGMACAGKTGTTNDKKDGWFCGLTPYYTTAIWIGYDSPKTVGDLYGNTYPLRTWEQFMNAIHEGLSSSKQFEISKSVIKGRNEKPAQTAKPKKENTDVDTDPDDEEPEPDDPGEEPGGDNPGGDDPVDMDPDDGGDVDGE